MQIISSPQVVLFLYIIALIILIARSSSITKQSADRSSATNSTTDGQLLDDDADEEDTYNSHNQMIKQSAQLAGPQDVGKCQTVVNWDGVQDSLVAAPPICV